MEAMRRRHRDVRIKFCYDDETSAIEIAARFGFE
jgi:hypothetical protein